MFVWNMIGIVTIHNLFMAGERATSRHSLFFFCYLRLPFIDDLIACWVKTPTWNALVIRKCKKLTLIKCLALLSSPRVVWRELSAPTGTRSFRFSRQLLRWARRFFSSSLWVDLVRKVIMRKIFTRIHGKISDLRATLLINDVGKRKRNALVCTWLHSKAYERQVFRLYQQLSEGHEVDPSILWGFMFVLI